MRDIIFIKPGELLTWERYVEISKNVTYLDKDNIQGELLQHAAIYAYYNGLLNNLQKNVDSLSNELERTSAGIREHHDGLYRVANNSKPTDKYLESKVLNSEGYQKLQNTKVELEYQHNLVKSLVKGLEARKDCLIQLSSNFRAEAKLFG